ncbi:hypothetical protein ACJ6WD_10685 [Streptomyces sp. VTCC 41912]|uniref:hypothetical protein n=1 Tax=Streptomyces sp. VTCC 41912 TaxID=3383243 RepID=UPI0038969F39
MCEYLVWCENGDLVSGPHRKRDVAERKEREAREECAKNGCGNGHPESSDDPDYGTTCGVLNPHGFSIQVAEDGRDITGHDY